MYTANDRRKGYRTVEANNINQFNYRFYRVQLVFIEKVMKETKMY